MHKFEPDLLLKLPKKIEFVSYPSGGCGDFFCSLISSHWKFNKNISTELPQYVNINNIPRYQSPKYFFINKSNPGHNLVKRLEFLLFYSYYMNYTEVINITKYILISEMLHFNSLHDSIIGNKEFPKNNELIKRFNLLYKNTIFIFPLHFWMWPDENVKAFSSTEYWSILNISPTTNKGIEFCEKSFNNIFCKEIETSRLADALKSGNIHFPFLELVMNKQFNEIIDFIKIHYGDAFNFENILKQLEYYYNNRISPLL
jgi:hypothetical protein